MASTTGYKAFSRSTESAGAALVLDQADGAPTDAMFSRPPGDGTLVVAHNGTVWGLYARIEGAWTLLSPAA